MRVPVEWLREFVDFSLSPKELAHRLTMTGLEVEALEEVQGETVLEVNVTPNRPDCLSILGIAREVSALMALPLKFPEYDIRDEADACAVAVEILDSDLCHRYAGREILGVTIQDSPEWMRKRLEQCGMRQINNVVDITNYVLLELGHPLHAFDRDELKGKTIRVARSRPGGAITTLDGTDRTLPDGALLIWDAERSVAVAGVMGGSETEVTEKTRNIFLESAYFFPASIRRTAKALGLKTESSYRFERGTDIGLLDRALDRAALLMSRLAGGTVSKKTDVYPRPFRPNPVAVRYERVGKVLGVSIPHDEIIDIVRRLGLTVTEESTTGFLAVPPSYRSDVQREIDVIEEVARFFGYDRIPVTVPKSEIPKAARDSRFGRVLAVKDFIRGAGFTEAINYSFLDARMLDALSLSADDPRRRTLTLRNPINTEEPHLRTTLVPSLIRNLVSNLSMGARDLRLFEISRIFLDRGEALPEERHHLGAVYFRDRAPSLWKDETPDFYLVKGVIESILDELGIRNRAFRSSSEPFLHPGRACDILVSGEKTGFLGALHPDVVEPLALRVSRPEILIFEIDLDTVLSSVPEMISYQPLPRFPHIDRDVALVVEESLPASAVLEQMRAYPTDLVEEISVFDFYRGEKIPGGKKSLAFSIRYRAKDRTLTDAEIEELHEKLVRQVTERTGGSVRGA